MNKFVIVDGLPYLYAGGKTYAVRWDVNGFTVGAEVKLASVPAVTYSELSVKGKCAGHLDSIGAEPTENTETEPTENTETEPTENTETEPTATTKTKRKRKGDAV